MAENNGFRKRSRKALKDCLDAKKRIQEDINLRNEVLETSSNVLSDVKSTSKGIPRPISLGVNVSIQANMAMAEVLKQSSTQSEELKDDETDNDMYYDACIDPEQEVEPDYSPDIDTNIWIGSVQHSISASDTADELIEEEMKFCSKTAATAIGELLNIAMKSMKIKDQANGENDPLWNEHLETCKLKFEDILKIKEIDDELEDTVCLVDQDEDDLNASEDVCYDNPIFDGAQITLGTSILLIMTYALRYSLSGNAIADLSLLVSLHCGVPNLCKTSLRSFKSMFKGLSAPVSFHRYCSYCLLLIDNESLTHCQNIYCNKELTASNAAYFLTMNVSSQLQSLFNRPGFISDLNHRFTRKDLSKQGVIQDIYDGEQYQRLFPDGPLGDPGNISLLWNTDGAPVFNSSKFSIWPFYLSINELPYQKRIKRENQLLAGLWFGDVKPQMVSFLKPICKELEDLESRGVEISIAGTEPFICKCFLLAGTCDLPAKCIVCNSTQFNGYYGCFKCMLKALSVPAGKGNVTVFPFKDASTAEK